MMLLVVLALAGCESTPVVVDGGLVEAGVVDDAPSPIDAATNDAGFDVRPECNPLATTDECLFPFPSRFFQAPDPSTPTGVRTALQRNSVRLPSAAATLDITMFNRADGHSPTAPMLVHLGVDVDPASLVGLRDPERWTGADEPIAVFDMATGARIPVITEMDLNQRTERYVGRHALIIRPMIAMPLGARVVVALSDSLRDADGRPLPISRGFLALRDGTPTMHEALEASRPAYEEIFTFLAAHGRPRESLGLAFDFRVASERHVVGGMLSMRDQALAAARTEGELSYTIDRIVPRPNLDVLRFVEGTFQAATFIDEDDVIHRDENDGAIRQTAERSFPFTMIVPRCAETATESLPLLLFGHGIFGEGRNYLEGSIGQQVIQPLANEACFVVVATDFIGLAGPDLEVLVDELIMDLNRIVIVMDRLQQAIINNLTLVELTERVIQLDPMVRVSDTRPLLSGEIFYYGVSLGGIEGSGIVSLSPSITRAVLAVPGGAWSTMLARSFVYTPIKTLVDIRYPDPLLQIAFITLLQERFDGADGANLAQLAFRRPLADAPADRRFLLFESIGDCQVPNAATRILARSFGVRQLEPFVEEIPLLDPIMAPTMLSSIAQLEMTSSLAMYRPSDEPRVPEEDNGVHSDALTLPQALDQVRALFLDGEIRQFCTGPCDPN